MKVGILTFQNTGNFGAVLQAYSLCTYLMNKNIDVSIINYHNKKIEEREFTWDDVKFTYFFNPKKIVKIFYIDKLMKQKYQNFQIFLRQGIKYDDKDYCEDNADEMFEDYDAIIVGSDQVWNTTITGHDKTYFLDSDDVIKISYAASIGDVKDIDSHELLECINRFDLVSVREYQAKEFIEKRISKDVSLVSDPTLLLGRDYWKRFVGKESKSNYLLLYFYDVQLEKDALNYAEKNGLDVLVISYGLPKKRYKTVSPTKVEEILSLIANASVVFTSSFHAVVFSCYFHTPFYAQNSRNPARIANLLRQLGIENKKLDESISDMAAFDWKSVDRNMDVLQEQSAKYVERVVGLLNNEGFDKKDRI
ncbi:MAG: polysaccharide pyruvyl transferase family protein [Oscillospiraceae bacterium]|nr:polysaccharide pyruvyl transferase family protein [Oscillospiraceae bacterium]